MGNRDAVDRGRIHFKRVMFGRAAATGEEQQLCGDCREQNGLLERFLDPNFHKCPENLPVLPLDTSLTLIAELRMNQCSISSRVLNSYGRVDIFLLYSYPARSNTATNYAQENPVP